MGHRRHVVLVALLLSSSALAATQLGPVYVYSGTAPSGTCTGSRVWVSDAGVQYCCVTGTWTTCGGGGSGLPSDPAACTAGSYVTDQNISGTLTCSVPPGTYSLPAATATVLGGVKGTGSALVCAGTGKATGFDSGGALQCGADLDTTPTFDQLGNPSGDSAITVPSTKKILWTFSGNTDEAFSVHGDGAFGGAGHLMHLEMSSTTALAGSDVLHIAFADADTKGIDIVGTGATSQSITTDGKATFGGLVTATGGFSGALSGNASTASALSSDPTACGAGTYVTDIAAAGTLTCGTPAGTYSLPAASTTLGGVKMAAACSAGNHVASIGAGGELTCTADAGGTGAPTGAQYWVGAADAGLSAEKDLSGFTGLVLNTAGTPSSKASNTCTNQFARSDTASGVWTCASIAAADLPTITVAKGGTNLTTIAANQVWVGTAADTVAVKTLPSCSNATTSKLLFDSSTQTFSCGTDQTGGGGGAGTLTRLTATWASSAAANTLGIVGTGGVPMTSPSYAAGAPYSGSCQILMTRPGTSNQPRYGIQSSGTVTTANTYAVIGLAGTLPARTEALQSTNALATAGCAAGCTANVVTGGAARVFVDTIEIAGVRNATGTISLVMAPSAAAAHTAQIGSYCIWY